jgi:hypothetical protein
MQVLLIIKGQGKLCGAYMVTLLHQALYLSVITFGRLVIMNGHQKDMCSTYVTYLRVNSHKGQYYNWENLCYQLKKKDLGFDPLQILHLKRQF